MNRYSLIHTFFVLAAALGVSAGVLSSCADTLEVGTLDSGTYTDADRLTGYAYDTASGASSNVIELTADGCDISLSAGLNRCPEKGVDLKFVYDSGYQQGTPSETLPLFPETMVTFVDGQDILMAPDEKRSADIRVHLNGGQDLVDGTTYVLPLKVVSSTAGVTIPESFSRCVYTIEYRTSYSNTYKGDDAVSMVLFLEVNGTNPLNALEFVLDNEEETMFFDYVVMFSANINYDADAGRAYLYCNPNVQYLLDHNEEFIQPLRKRGIKVILGLLGNHDQSGLTQLSDVGARDFAKEVAAVCEAYSLDGVNLDNEWSDSPDLGNPLFAPAGPERGNRLCYEIKKLMPDKCVMVYQYNSIAGDFVIDGVEPGKFIDIAVPDYGAAGQPYQGMTIRQCAGTAINLMDAPKGGTEFNARSVKEGGYGYYMMYALYGGDVTKKESTDKYPQQVESCNNVSYGLYGVRLKPVEHFYHKNSTEPVAFAF